jgi:hypothetical protein
MCFFENVLMEVCNVMDSGRETGFLYNENLTVCCHKGVLGIFQ